MIISVDLNDADTYTVKGPYCQHILSFISLQVSHTTAGDLIILHFQSNLSITVQSLHEEAVLDQVQNKASMTETNVQWCDGNLSSANEMKARVLAWIILGVTASIYQEHVDRWDCVTTIFRWVISNHTSSIFVLLNHAQLAQIQFCLSDPALSEKNNMVWTC